MTIHDVRKLKKELIIMPMDKEDFMNLKKNHLPLSMISFFNSHKVNEKHVFTIPAYNVSFDDSDSESVSKFYEVLYNEMIESGLSLNEYLINHYFAKVMVLGIAAEADSKKQEKMLDEYLK